MTAAMKFGGLLLTYWWVAVIVIGIIFVALLFVFGGKVLDVVKAVFDFMRSPAGYPVIVLLVIYLAMCVGYNWADGICDAASLKRELAAERQARADTERELKEQAKIEQNDAVRAALDEEINRRNQEQVNAPQDETPSAACLDRDAAGRVRNVR